MNDVVCALPLLTHMSSIQGFTKRSRRLHRQLWTKVSIQTAAPPLPFVHEGHIGPNLDMEPSRMAFVHTDSNIISLGLARTHKYGAHLAAGISANSRVLWTHIWHLVVLPTGRVPDRTNGAWQRGSV